MRRRDRSRNDGTSLVLVTPRVAALVGLTSSSSLLAEYLGGAPLQARRDRHGSAVSPGALAGVQDLLSLRLVEISLLNTKETSHVTMNSKTMRKRLRHGRAQSRKHGVAQQCASGGSPNVEKSYAGPQAAQHAR